MRSLLRRQTSSELRTYLTEVLAKPCTPTFESVQYIAKVISGLQASLYIACAVQRTEESDAGLNGLVRHQGNRLAMGEQRGHTDAATPSEVSSPSEGVERGLAANCPTNLLTVLCHQRYESGAVCILLACCSTISTEWDLPKCSTPSVVYVARQTQETNTVTGDNSSLLRSKERSEQSSMSHLHIEHNASASSKQQPKRKAGRCCGFMGFMQGVPCSTEIFGIGIGKAITASYPTSMPSTTAFWMSELHHIVMIS